MRRAFGAVLRFARYLASAVLVVLALASLIPAGCLLALAYACWPVGVPWSTSMLASKEEAERWAGAVATHRAGTAGADAGPYWGLFGGRVN